MDLNISFPSNMKRHIDKIIAGEYALPVTFDSGLVILDVGANVGSFAAWASQQWKGVIHCYEPLKSNYDFLVKNTEPFKDRCITYNVAVEAPSNILYLGKNNCGEASCYNLGEQTEESVTIESIKASTLPDADIIKLDCEGSEIPVLEGYFSISRAEWPLAIMLEYHREGDRRLIDDMLIENYILVELKYSTINTGIIKYLHRKVFGHF